MALAAICFGSASAASAAEFPYQFDPVLSLTGDCSTSSIDPVPDPDCPYPSPPGGPSGRFDQPRSIAVDAYGNEYVASYAGDGLEGRIDIFDDEGNFLTEMADPFGPRSIAVDSQGTLYVVEWTISAGSESKLVRYSPTVYEPEAGKVEYGNPRVVIADASGGIAVDASNDRLFVAEGERITEYGSVGEGNKLLNTITPKDLTSSQWVGVDSQRRRLYASSCREKGIFDCEIMVLEADAPYGLLKIVDGFDTPAGQFVSNKGWLSTAVDEETGHFFVDDLELSKNVYEFNENYEYVSKVTFSGFQGGVALQIAVSNSALNSDANNRGYLFVPVALSAGRALAFEPPGVLPPEVLEIGVASVGETEAELQASIDTGGGDTDYVFEYVTQQDFESEGFAGGQVAGKGTIDETGLTQRVTALISDLSAGTKYRFRVVVTNEVGKGEAEAGFATYANAPLGNGPCVNEHVRIGDSSVLPDCRAYELVTPPDTNGRSPRGTGFSGDLFATLEASPDGNSVSFLTEGGSLPGTDGTGGWHGDSFQATRTSTGWMTVGVGPSGDETTIPRPGSHSPDQDHAFWVAQGEGSAVIDGKHTQYIRYPDGHSALIGRGSLGTDQAARGVLITENGSHIVFQTTSVSAVPQQLEPNAPPDGTEAVYDRTADEVTHVVSLLPGDITPAAGQNAKYLGASVDGEGIAFSIGGTLYLREDNAETYEIGNSIEFAGVSVGGERIFYVEGGDLYAFDTDTEEAIAFSAVTKAVPVNVAPDGTRAYFVSTEAIPGGGQNPNGAFAKAGQRNLYLSEEGDVTFVATVTARDVEGEVNGVGARIDGLGLWTEVHALQPSKDPSRLTPDGSVLLFQSRANLDGYDPNGSPQIYRYDDVADRLHCISCIPTRTPASGGASLQSVGNGQDVNPPFLEWFSFVPNLRADGRRAFFQSTEALVSYDTDEVQDVYEWEEEGVGGCEREGGCVYLISSGRSGRDNYLFGHSASGDDVFFTTTDVLNGFDAGDTPSIYDAKVGGGFPEPSVPVCQGEGCRPGLLPAPVLPAPESGARSESANVSPRRSTRPCAKGKRKVKRNGKVRCVKKQRKGQGRQPGTRKGAAR